jgi:hypothetical protein
MLYHDFEAQYNLFQACLRRQVSLFITWDSGMELQVSLALTFENLL